MISYRTRLTALFTASIALAVLAGCLPSARKSTATPPPPRTTAVSIAPPAGSLGADSALAPVTDDRYVGDAACAVCHAPICRQFHRTRHAGTLHIVTAQTDGQIFRLSPRVSDPESDTTYRMAVRNGGCVMSSDGPGGNEVITAHFAVGSGRFGLTYVGQDGHGQWYEMRMTYFTQEHRWGFTPQLQPDPNRMQDPAGLHLDTQQVAGCLSCHVTTLTMQQEGPDTKASHLGIGCERCHGPGKRHVEAMRAAFAGKPSASDTMADLNGASATRLTQICGECHRAPFDVPTDAQDAKSLFRFASTALEQSKCFKASGALSCISCHDPHTNVRTNMAAYEAVCLSCHNPAKTTATRSVSSPLICKVDPHKGCIPCHMPLQTGETFAATTQHNHWIRIWTPGRK